MATTNFAVPPQKRTARFLVLAWGVLLTVAATWLFAHEGHAPLPTKGVVVDSEKGMVTLGPDARNILDVRTEEVSPRVAEDKVLAYATLVAPWQQHAFLSTRLPGRIVNLFVKPGHSVKAGQVLAEVQSLEMEDLQLEILNLETALQLAFKVMEQTKALSAGGALPVKDHLEAVNKHQQTANGLEVAKAKWFSLGLGTEKLEQLMKEKNPRLFASLPIVSPMSGTVIHADVSIGKVVEPTEHLFEVMDLASVWVKVGVLERDLHRISTGQPIELKLSAFPDEVVTATVQIKSLYLDPVSHLGTVWGELKNPPETSPQTSPRFLPGMSGQAQVVLSSPKKLLTVPANAIVRDGPERYVLVETSSTSKASEYQKRSVVIGVEADEWTQILGGEIFAGDRVVTTGLTQLAAYFVPGVLRPSREAAKNMGLVVEPVEMHDVENIVALQGAVEVPTDRRASASSQIAGKIQKISVDRNQAVKKGDVVAEIASTELQKLQLDLLQAHLELGLVEATLTRIRKVEAVISQRQLWDAESLRNELVNRHDSLKRKLETVGLSIEDIADLLKSGKLVETLPVRAPRDGVAVHFGKVLGQVIKADEPLFEIHDLSQGYVQAFLSEREWTAIRIGQKVRVRLVADPSFVAEGTVELSGNTFGADNRILSVWVKLDQNGLQPLQHNLLARLTVSVGRPASVLSVPLGAVVQEGTKSFVFVLDDKGLFQRRLIELGKRSDDRFAEVVAGLQLSERIAVQGASALQTAYANIR
ncbi:MAG: efflux RND transporter periplasmic adaptor subunit [Gemmataceae bacterium]|nr:efflux RND transporter periplasmic adaptor subunit [Gemmataceae bacterium]